jgi:hypothetical protein
MKTAKLKLKSGKPKHEMGEIQTIKKLFGFRQFLLRFPGFSKESW